jgi:hypothetical protein
MSQWKRGARSEQRRPPRGFSLNPMTQVAEGSANADLMGTSRRTSWRMTFGAMTAAVGSGLLIGWLVLGDTHIDADGVDIAVALGTLLTALCTAALGAATVYLALKTRDVVAATQSETQVARHEIAIAQEQASTARQTLEAQTQPFFTVGSTNPSVLNAHSAHVRNAGSGTAIVLGSVFIAPDGTDHPAAAVDPAVPPGESTAVVIPGDLGGRFAAAENFSVAVSFADVSGRNRGAVRLDVYKVSGNPAEGIYAQPPRWRVRQVFWADTMDAVRHSPAFGTQPVDAAPRSGQEDSLELMVVQRERDAADAADRALRALQVGINDGSIEGPNLPDVHNNWQDSINEPVLRIRDEEIQRRASVLGWTIYFAMQSRSGTHWSYAVLRATEDVRAALAAFLNREPVPASRFPDEVHLRSLVRASGAAATFDQLNEWLSNH